MKLNDKTVKKISSFIKEIIKPDEVLTDNSKIEVFFSLGNEGGLILYGDDARDYKNCLYLLISDIHDEKISNKTIENLFRLAIVRSLDITQKQKDKSFEERLSSAISELERSFSEEPKTYLVYSQVSGLAKDNLPVQIGNVKFCVFDESQKTLFTKPLLTIEGDESLKASNLRFVEKINSSQIIDKTVALMEIIAYDADAAKALAFNHLVHVIDLINFFSDLIPYEKGYIYLPGEREKIIINEPVILKNDKPIFSFGYRVLGSPTDFSFSKLFEIENKHNLGFSTLSKILSKDRMNIIEERLISAIQWAGKATINNRKEEAFVQFSISLESLILPEGDRNQICKRLRNRVANLLGKNSKDKRIIKKNITDLYDIRSNIVHDGSYQVTDADLFLLMNYIKSSILQILNDPKFSSLADIESYLKILEGRTSTT